MNVFDILIDPDILNVAFELFKRKREVRDEKTAFLQVLTEAIQIHIIRLKDGLSSSDFKDVAKELYEALATTPQTQEEKVLDSVCLSFRHDFGLLSEEERNSIRFQAKEWLVAWRKHLDS